MLLGPDQRGHGNPVLLAHVDHRLWRYTKRVGDQPDRVTERRLKHLQRRCPSKGCGWLSATLVSVSSMSYFFRRFRVNARCSLDIRASRLFQVTFFSPDVEMFSGISTSSP